MPKIAVLAKITAAPGKREEVAAAFDNMFSQVEDEPGTELYVLHDDSSNADVLWMYELYTDGDALQAHSTSPAMLEAFGTFAGDLMGAPPELMILAPRGAKGVAL